nr:MAG TPA: hypothetical protein [Caudoviricetes sp.]
MAYFPSFFSILKFSIISLIIPNPYFMHLSKYFVTNGFLMETNTDHHTSVRSEES